MDEERFARLEEESASSSMAWSRSVKRKVEEIGETDRDGKDCAIFVDLAARVDAENELVALREAVARQQRKIAELCKELEHERAASASSATEAMSMILRLQREKAEVLMEARQFKRFAEEKMAHDQQELMILEDLIFKREQSLQALSCEVQAFRHRLLSYGVDPDSLFSDQDSGEDQSFNWADDRLIKNPHQGVRLQDLERRIHHLEKAPDQMNKLEISAVVGSPNSGQQLESPMGFDGPTGDDESSGDRIYTIDAVHIGTPTVKVCEDHLTRGEVISSKEETEIQRLYARLQALELDRESMKQAIMSMQTEKTQVLLREIAQQMYRDGPARKVVAKKQSSQGRFSFMSAIKWVVSFVFRWKPKKQTRYMFDQGRLGLLLLLENSSIWRQQLLRILPRIRGKSSINSSPRPPPQVK
ncbi:myosin-binding protein 7-like [Wolffia australiana]